MGIVVGMEEAELLRGCPYTSTVTPFHSLQKGKRDPE